MLHAALSRRPRPAGHPDPARAQRRHLRHHPGAAGRLRRLHPLHADQPGRRHRRGGRDRRPRPIARPTASTIRLPIQYFHWITGIVTRFDFGHSLYYNKPVGDVVAERLPRHHPAGADLPHPGLGHRHHASASSPPRASTAGSIRCFGFISFLGMTIPRFLLALIILYILVFRLNVQEIGSFFSSQYGGAPWSWDKFVEPRPARLAGDLHRHLRRARLQHARDAREPARRAQRAVCRDRARQGPAAKAP